MGSWPPAIVFLAKIPGVARCVHAVENGATINEVRMHLSTSKRHICKMKIGKAWPKQSSLMRQSRFKMKSMKKRSFTSIQKVHTHTHPRGQSGRWDEVDVLTFHKPALQYCSIKPSSVQFVSSKPSVAAISSGTSLVL